MMGFRIAWFKIHYPLALHAAFFSIRATAFDYALMCQGKAALDRNIKITKQSEPGVKAAGYLKGYENCAGNVCQRF